MSGLISIRGVTKTFGTEANGVPALAPVDLDIDQGEFISIVGPSGCGKSTLLNLVAGLFMPTRGEIFIDGKKVEGVPENIGMVFQQYSKTLLPWRSVYENIGLGLELKGMAEKERRRIVEKYVEFMGLSGFEKKKPYELSGGMQQRVALARTLSYRPSILLMDEPYASVDAQTREVLQEDILRIRERERQTVLLVTHDIREAIYLGDRVVVMSARPGRIKGIFDVNFLNSRRGPGVKSAAEFTSLSEKVWGLIKDEVLVSLRDRPTEG